MPELIFDNYENYNLRTSTFDEPIPIYGSTDDLDIRQIEWTTMQSGFGVGQIDRSMGSSIVITADTFQIQDRSANITVDISNDMLSNIESIEINGFKFVREDNNNV